MNKSLKGWICEVDKVAAGFIITNNDSGEISVIAVSQLFEGRGIGKQLLDEAVSWLYSLGHYELWLYENPDPSIRAYTFYRTYGWIPEGEVIDGMQKMILKK